MGDSSGRIDVGSFRRNSFAETFSQKQWKCSNEDVPRVQKKKKNAAPRPVSGGRVTLG
jgi:hypothetical protein